MARFRRSILLALVPLLATAGDGGAAPQDLALLETDRPTALVCAGGVCSAQFSTLCMQKERDMPVPGTVYGPHRPDSVVLVLHGPDGSVRRRPATGLVRMSPTRNYVSVTMALAETELARLGAVVAAIEVTPLASLVPSPEAEDTTPLTDTEVARATGPLRKVVDIALGYRERDAVAARATMRLINALDTVSPVAEDDERRVLWESVANDLPYDAAHPGIAGAREVVAACRRYAVDSLPGGFQSCLETRHDGLLTGLNGAYYRRVGYGS